MAKNRQNITRDFLGNGRRIQEVLNAPRYLKEKYLSPKGKRLLLEAHGDKEQIALIWSKYGKNRLIPNPACTHVVKIITHATV